MLFSGYIKQKTTAINSGREKPIQSSAGFMIHILSLLPLFGKSLERLCQRRKQKFHECNINSGRTFEDISSFVWIWLEVVEHLGERLGGTQSRPLVAILKSCYNVSYST